MGTFASSSIIGSVNISDFFNAIYEPTNGFFWAFLYLCLAVAGIILAFRIINWLGNVLISAFENLIHKKHTNYFVSKPRFATRYRIIEDEDEHTTIFREK